MGKQLIHNAIIVNEGKSFKGSVLIEDDKIAHIYEGDVPTHLAQEGVDTVIDAEGTYLIPGVIDEHVHFRDPGLTQKADVESESRAAAAGGVTSVMDMPNTMPLTTTLEAWEEKMELYGQKSAVNYSCYFGATNNNANLLKHLNRHRVCGVKLFMGASTGNMLVDNSNSLTDIFNGTDLLIATHCEDQKIIKENIAKYKQMFAGEEVPIKYHPKIRSEEACYSSSQVAVKLAKDAGARLHIMHISTAKELELFDASKALEDKKITAEACISHLCFSDKDYEKLGAKIKCNPSVKSISDRDALREALNNNLIDSIATDHAPHLLSDKVGGALNAASGIPTIQYSLLSILELVKSNILTIEQLVQKMCHAPATIYQIDKRGFIREGYSADLVLIRPNSPWSVTPEQIESKCKWSPFEGDTFHWKIEKTFVNGKVVYDGTSVDATHKGKELSFRTE